MRYAHLSEDGTTILNVIVADPEWIATQSVERYEGPLFDGVQCGIGWRREAPGVYVDPDPAGTEARFWATSDTTVPTVATR